MASDYKIFWTEEGLRNSINYHLSRRFDDQKWYDNIDFIKVASRYQINKISNARLNIQSTKN